MPYFFNKQLLKVAIVTDGGVNVDVLICFDTKKLNLFYWTFSTQLRMVNNWFIVFMFFISMEYQFITCIRVPVYGNLYILGK